MSDVLLMILRIGAAVYLGLCLLVFLRQASYVYYPTRRVEGDPSLFGLAFEDLTLQSGGTAIHAWYVPAAGDAAPAVLFCHGNGGNIGDRLASIRTLHELGFSVLIFDYRGYGRSRGRPSERGTYEDALAAWAWLTDEQGIPPSRIIVFGRSLGGAVASTVAVERDPAMLVLESTFTSAPAMAGTLFPWLPARWLCRFRYDNLARIARVRCPVMVAHSPDDDNIPFAMGKALYRAAPEPRSFVALSGDHNNGGMDNDAGYRRAFMAFWEEYGDAT